MNKPLYFCAACDVSVELDEAGELVFNNKNDTESVVSAIELSSMDISLVKLPAHTFLHITSKYKNLEFTICANCLAKCRACGGPTVASENLLKKMAPLIVHPDWYNVNANGSPFCEACRTGKAIKIVEIKPKVFKEKMKVEKVASNGLHVEMSMNAEPDDDGWRDADPPFDDDLPY